MSWPRSSLCTPAVRYTVSWLSSTSIWIDSHSIACYFIFLLFPGLRTIFKYASWVISSVATIAASRWMNWCLRCCCVSLGGALFEEPVGWLDSASITPGCSISRPIISVVKWGERRSWKEVRSSGDYIVSYKSNWNEWQSTRNFNWAWIRLCIAALHIAAGYSSSPTIWSMSPQWCLFVRRDIWWWMTADISFLIDINKRFFDGKDIWWCLPQDLAGIIHESHAHHQVPMYGQHDYSQWSNGQNPDFALF